MMNQIVKWIKTRTTKDPDISVKEAVVISTDDYPLFSVSVAGPIFCEGMTYKGETFSPTSKDYATYDSIMEMTSLDLPRTPGVMSYKTKKKITNTPMYRILYTAKMALEKYAVHPVFLIMRNIKTDAFEVVLPRQHFNECYGRVRNKYINEQVLTLTNYELIAEVRVNTSDIAGLDDIPSRALILMDTTGDSIDKCSAFIPYLGKVDASNLVDMTINYAVKEPTQLLSKSLEIIKDEPECVDLLFFSNSKEEREKQKLMSEHKTFFDYLHWEYYILLDKITKKEIDLFLTLLDEPKIKAEFEEYKKRFEDKIKRGIPPRHEADHRDIVSYDEPADRDASNLLFGDDTLLLKRIEAIRSGMSEAEINKTQGGGGFRAGFGSEHYHGNYYED